MKAIQREKVRVVVHYFVSTSPVIVHQSTNEI